MSIRAVVYAAFLGVIALSPTFGGNVFVVPGSTGSTVGVYSTDPLGSLGTIQGSGSVSAVYSLPSGHYYVVTGGSSSSVATFDSTLKPGAVISGLGTITGSAFSPAGNMLAVIGSTGLNLIDTETDQVVATLNASSFGGAPYDMAFALNGGRLFVASTASGRITAVDVTGAPEIVTTTASVTAGGQLPLLLTVAPTGLLYVSAPNKLYVINGASMAVLDQVVLVGNPGRVVFAPDMSVAVVPNRVPSNGNNILSAFDPVAGTLIDSLPTSGVSETLNQVVYGGPSAAGVRFYATSTGNQVLYDITYPKLAIKQAAFSSPTGSIVGVTVSDEVVAPQYLFMSDTALLFRVALSTAGGGLSGAPLVLASSPKALFNAGPKAAGTPGTILAYNASQTVSSAANTFLPVTVRVLDASGKPLVGIAVHFKSTGNAITFNDISLTTNADGWAFATPSNPIKTGTYGISVSAGTVSTTGTLTVGTQPGGGGGATGSASGISPISGQGQVISPFTFPYTPPAPMIVQVTNSSGAPLPNVLVTFTLDQGSSASQLVSSEGTSDAPGSTCSTQLLCTGQTDSNGKVGVLVGAFQLLGTSVPYVQGKVTAKTSTAKSTSFIFSVLSNNVTPQYSLLKPTSGTITVPAGSKSTGAVKTQLLLFDPRVGYVGLPSAGLSVFTAVSDPKAGVTASCDGAGGVTLSDSQGIASCDLIAGPYVGTAELTIQSGNQQFTTILKVVAGTPAHVNIEQGNNQSGAPGAQLPLALRANVTDLGGNLLVGQKVNWVVANPQAVTLTNIVSVTDTNGRVSATATLGNVSGPQTVTVSVPGTAASATFTLTVNAAIGGLTITGGNNQSALQNAAFTQPLAVQVTDKSTPPKGVAGVTVSFAVQGSGVTLSANSATTDSNGNASVTATAGGSPGTVNVVASSGNLSQTFTLTVRPPGPVFGLDDLLNGASFQVQKQVAPGQILTIAGTGVSNGAQGVVVPKSMVGPLPTSLNGVQVAFYQGTSTTGTLLAAPIYNVADVNGLEQVTVLVPFELQPGTATMVIVAGGAASDPLQVPVVLAQPGIFQTTDSSNNTYAVVLHSNGSYVTVANPATRGETLRCFVTSLGQTTPAASTYSAGVANQMVTGTVIVGVADAGVQVIASKYVEDFAGLYTVDFVVPSNAPSGLQVKLNLALLTADSSLYYSNATYLPIQ